jgi:SAM-dependent methyltransferase
MRGVSHALLVSARLPEGPLLEVGCGGGAFARELAARQVGRVVAATDLRPAALQTAFRPEDTVHLAQSDVHALPYACGCFALVTALDVVDQLGVRLDAALGEIYRVLQPGGWLLARVSAYPWLEGTHDVAFNTGRRYWRSELVAAAGNAGFAVIRATYANTLLAPPIVVMRLLQRWKLLPYQPLVDEDNLANRAARRTLAVEARWLRARELPFGISLYILAVK